MLVAPIIAALLYSVYLLHGYLDKQRSVSNLEAIYGEYLPAVDLANQNAILLDSVATALKDAVLAGEREWVSNTQLHANRIIENLGQLAAYENIVPAQHISAQRQQFHDYYSHALKLSLSMLDPTSGAEQNNALIDGVERSYVASRDDFQALHGLLAKRLEAEIQRIQYDQRHSNLVALAIGATLLLVTLWITFQLSLSTRRNLDQVKTAMRELAQQEPDFSRRLSHASNDELGELTYWFNALSDKLEENYTDIERLSVTDKLTGLWNRAKIDQLFEQELARARRYAQPLSVVLIDLDHFKAVNDGFGHQVGDAVLVDIAGLFRNQTRQTDHLGRWGGEEFIVLLPNTGIADASRFAEKLLEATARHEFARVGRQTLSAGVAAYRDGDTQDSLTRRGDDCLYRAKALGRNRVVAESQLDQTG
ncbi:MAG: diguanylate cyclase [Chromatiales bacterium]|nr:diguanylate cyclase [Chromatiales bacterium]